MSSRGARIGDDYVINLDLFLSHGQTGDTAC
jgi:hypothetical protein